MSQQNTPTKRERRDAARAQRLEQEQASAAVDARRKRVIQLGALLAAAVVVVVVAIVISSGGAEKKSSGAGTGGTLQGVAETKSLFAGIPQKGITLGNANAPVTIVEFADPQCPFCKDYTLNDMPALVEKYVRTGKAKMELRLLTFIGPDSVTAASVLTAAGQQNKLWNATDLFYRYQGEENSGYVTDDFLTEVLTGAGADAKKAIADAGDPAVSQEIAAAKTLTSRYDVTGTPTVLVGPTGGELKSGGEGLPTAASVGKQVDAALAAKSGE
jgi:protein-disulfide isomerase